MEGIIVEEDFFFKKNPCKVNKSLVKKEIEVTVYRRIRGPPRG